MIDSIHSKKLDRPEAAQIAASAVAVGLHYAGAVALSPEALAAALTALVIPLVMMGLRMMAPVAEVAEDGGEV